MGLILLILLCWLWDGRRGAGRGVPPCGRDRALFGPGGPHGAPWRGLRPAGDDPYAGAGRPARGRRQLARPPGLTGAAFAALRRAGASPPPVLGPTRRAHHNIIFSLSVMRKSGMRGWRAVKDARSPQFSRTLPSPLRSASRARENRLPRARALTGVRDPAGRGFPVNVPDRPDRRMPDEIPHREKVRFSTHGGYHDQVQQLQRHGPRDQRAPRRRAHHRDLSGGVHRGERDGEAFHRQRSREAGHARPGAGRTRRRADAGDDVRRVPRHSHGGVRRRPRMGLRQQLPHGGQAHRGP